MHHVISYGINRFQRASPIGMPFQGGETMNTVGAQRKEELLSDCIVSPDVFNHMMDRLGDFVVPYQHALARLSETEPVITSQVKASQGLRLVLVERFVNSV